MPHLCDFIRRAAKETSLPMVLSTQERLGRAVKHYREEVLRISQTSLARKFGFTPQWLSRIESGLGTMQPSTIAVLKDEYPALWKELATIYIEGTRKELGLEAGADTTDPSVYRALSRVREVLEAAEDEVRRSIESERRKDEGESNT